MMLLISYNLKMNLINLLILSTVSALVAQFAPHQPQEFLFVPVGGKAKISCVSNGTLLRISWYRRTWRVGENPELVLDWGEVNKGHKYHHREDNSSLEIYDVQEEDSGIYYCADLHMSLSLIFSKGTTLIAGDSFTANTSVHLMVPPSASLPNTSVQLACVASAVQHMVHITWNISGTCQKGRIIAMEEPGGTLTFLSYITIPRDTWYQGMSLSCQVKFNSSPTAVHRQATGLDAEDEGSHSTCFILALTVCLLLFLLLSTHLYWVWRRPVNARNAPWRREANPQDEILYSHLDPRSFPQRRQ
ncbi:hypothetical protein XELAEV_18040455mg [Xenopus laevis]|uniref:Ig-like domain-containing protein n=1 Tax=Xenopus laevis TaxID=8355 RepID=A0A974C9N2_XENLA|nr:hypothetical protein XELAEV_18040455mg [Xenopus laevis]